MHAAFIFPSTEGKQEYRVFQSAVYSFCSRLYWCVYVKVYTFGRSVITGRKESSPTYALFTYRKKPN